MPFAPSFDCYGGGLSTAVAQGKVSDTIIAAVPARLCRVIVTATGTAPTQIFDNPAAGSGMVIGIIPTATAVGTVLDFSMPAATGITVKGLATNHGFTVSYN
jgi:hypothetical protein